MTTSHGANQTPGKPFSSTGSCDVTSSRIHTPDWGRSSELTPCVKCKHLIREVVGEVQTNHPEVSMAPGEELANERLSGNGSLIVSSPAALLERGASPPQTDAASHVYQCSPMLN